MEIIVIAFVMVLEVVLTAFIIALMAEKKNERPLVSQLKIKQRKADDPNSERNRSGHTRNVPRSDRSRKRG